MATRAPEVAPALRQARFAAAAGFFTQGLVFISLTTRLPDVQEKWSLSSVEMSVLLLMMVLLAGVGSLVAEMVAKRSDSAEVLRAGLLLIAVCLPVIALAPAFAAFAAALALYGVALGVVDATTNMQAVALEHRYGRPILPSFHGAWTLGGVVGSALTLATGNLGLGAAAWLAVVPLAVCFAPLLRRADVPVAPTTSTCPGGRSCWWVWRWCSSTWSTRPPRPGDRRTSTRRSRPRAGWWRWRRSPTSWPAWSFRFAGDALVARHGVVRVLRVGAVVSSAALAVVVFAPTWPVAVLGFTLLGAGAAVIAPLSFSAAARIAGGDTLDADARAARVDAVIARFNQFNYAGALLGAVLTGLVGADSLRYGFALPMVLVLGILPLAPAFAGRRG